MMYEREITTMNAKEKPIANWNIFDDVIVFQEHNQVCVVKCHEDKDCEFYSFILHENF